MSQYLLYNKKLYYIAHPNLPDVRVLSQLGTVVKFEQIPFKLSYPRGCAARDLFKFYYGTMAGTARLVPSWAKDASSFCSFFAPFKSFVIALA